MLDAAKSIASRSARVWPSSGNLRRLLRPLTRLAELQRFGYVVRTAGMELRDGHQEVLQRIADLPSPPVSAERVLDWPAYGSSIHLDQHADGEMVVFGQSATPEVLGIAVGIVRSLLDVRQDLLDAQERIRELVTQSERRPDFHVEVSSKLEHAELAPILLRPLVEETGADAAYLYLIADGREPRLAGRRGRQLNRKTEPSDKLLRHAVAALVKAPERRFLRLRRHGEVRLPLPFTAAVVIPLRFADDIRGLACLLAELPERLNPVAARRAALWAHEIAWALHLRGSFMAQRMARARDADSAEAYLRSHVLGLSAATEQLRQSLLIAARARTPVLLEGETGTGKEVAARAIHAISQRRAKPFVAIDCPAIPENLVESELFGHVEGAFTGADRRRVGLFESADSGTVFLDEVHQLTEVLQAKLLRFLENSEIRPVGDSRSRTVDVRIIAASNLDLHHEATAGRFRRDLLYRLDVMRVRLPPLRDRRDDVPVLADHFLRRARMDDGLEPLKLSPGAVRLLQDHPWPGNVRELRNAMELAAITADGDVVNAEELHLRSESSAELGASNRSRAEILYAKIVTQGMSFFDVVVEPFRNHDLTRADVFPLIDRALDLGEGRYSAAARKLNVPDRQYQRFMDFLRNNAIHPAFRERSHSAHQ